MSTSDSIVIRELADAFDTGWRPDDWARLTDLVRRAPPHLAVAVAHRLIVIDIDRRAADRLTVPSPQSYLDMFPELADSDLGTLLGAAPDPPKAAVTPPPAAVPDRIGRYPVNSRLAAGGEAEVFLCFHPDWKTLVAVKWMRAEAADRGDWKERFARQGALLNGLEHPSIVRVFDQGEHQGRPFLVTEYIQGRTLEQYARDTRPDPAQAVEIVAQVAAALGHAHRVGVYHQDVKPDNVLIDDRGRVRLIDFGVAWFRPAWGGGADPHGCTAGTLGYLSPEQASGGEVTARTDVFALGGVLYFLLTGRAPYPRLDVPTALRRAAAGEWDREPLNTPAVPAGLRRVCDTAMAADPGARHASAEALAADAAAALRRPRPFRTLAVAGVLLCAFALAVAVGRWWGGRPQPSPPHPSVAAAAPVDLVVFAQRPGFDARPLGDVVPLRTGDLIDLRFRVPAGTHAVLASVNGDGRLSVLKAYPAGEARDAVWPAPGQAVELLPPTGTELLFVCGRTDRPPTPYELQAAWGAGEWPPLDPPGHYFRVRPSGVTLEGASRDFGPAAERPDADQLRHRLERLRENLKDFAIFDGIAFRHQ
jgi:predicted Ser/Thr protein kinase